ncbi:MAG: hypothetical protein RR288_04505 [Oscillibacter sp.]
MPENPVLTDDQTCPAIGYQSASICVPVTVTPFAKAGATFTKCCGNPVVLPGKNTCDGTKNGACVFTISQDICVAVPIDFGAVAAVGDTFVHCNGASTETDCGDCSVVPVLPDTPVVPVVLPEGKK